MHMKFGTIIAPPQNRSADPRNKFREDAIKHYIANQRAAYHHMVALMEWYTANRIHMLPDIVDDLNIVHTFIQLHKPGDQNVLLDHLMNTKDKLATLGTEGLLVAPPTIVTTHIGRHSPQPDTDDHPVRSVTSGRIFCELYTRLIKLSRLVICDDLQFS